MTEPAGEQLGLEGMPDRLFVVTPTRLNTWLECPRRYRMTYLDRPPLPKGAPWAHNSVGAAVHTALKRWYDLPAARRTVAAAGDLLEETWLDDGFRDDAQSARWRARARDMVEAYVAGVDAAEEPVGVERTVAFRTRTLAVSGRVDRIDDRAEEDLVIVDYKTGRRVPDEDECRGSLALAAYALGAQRTLHRPCHRVELHHLPSGQVTSWVHTEQSLARHVRRAEAIAAEASAAETRWRDGARDHPRARDEDFPPRPGPLCSWCDYRGHCPEGRTVSVGKTAWAGLADD